VPLCGKTLDMHWLLAQGMQVVGAELNPLAVNELFAELELTPTITKIGNIHHYHADNIDIFQGDFFEINQANIGKIDAIYDRAALVALPIAMRNQYSQHLINITAAAPQLLINFIYDQSLVDGPPFSVDGNEVITHYAKTYQIKLLADESMPTGLKGQYPAQEQVWLLQPIK
jgi:thiopurine S-methyltransferase